MNAMILAGGGSKRMGRDKAAIERPDGVRQLDHLVSLAEPFCDQIHLSLKRGTVPGCSLPVIEDLRPGEGPVAALEAAHAVCGGPLLVLGCDLFLLDHQTLQHLIDHRDPSSKATCFRNRLDGAAEPLCTIYEPNGLELAAAALDGGQRCARHFLESLDPRLLDLPRAEALDNANTPEQLAECMTKLQAGVVAKQVGVLYFAILREARGLDSERVNTLACTAAGLYDELGFKHRLPLQMDALRVAINGEFSTWDALLADGDEVVFIPPVAGG